MFLSTLLRLPDVKEGIPYPRVNMPPLRDKKKPKLTVLGVTLRESALRRRVTSGICELPPAPGSHSPESVGQLSPVQGQPDCTGTLGTFLSRLTCVQQRPTEWGDLCISLLHAHGDKATFARSWYCIGSEDVIDSHGDCTGASHRVLHTASSSSAGVVR